MDWNKGYAIALGILLILIIGLVVYTIVNDSVYDTDSSDEELQFCTADVMECPDGSFVSRDSRNNCEFRECP